jgi:hypothetical protein
MLRVAEQAVVPDRRGYRATRRRIVVDRVDAVVVLLRVPVPFVEAEVVRVVVHDVVPDEEVDRGRLDVVRGRVVHGVADQRRDRSPR